MREYKFRAWDTESKCMYDSDQLDITTLGHLKRAFEDIGWEIMQSTGMKDKNGVEIYEGDVVKALFRNNEGNKFIQGPIYFDEFMWCMDDNTHLKDDLEWTYSINRIHEVEVIGNIYANPELSAERNN